MALEKLHRLHELVGDRVLLSVDGGVNTATVSACAGPARRFSSPAPRCFPRMITADSSARWADWHGRHGARRPGSALTFQL